MRNILRAALVTGCAVAAMGGLVGVAAADTPSTDTVVQVYSAYLPPGHTDLPAFTCPDRFPYLLNQNLSPGRAVVRGMEVIEPGGIGVTDNLDTLTQPDNGVQYSTGSQATTWLDGATNYVSWMPTTQLTINLHCTNDQSRASQ